MPKISWDLRPILPQPLLSITSPQDWKRTRPEKLFLELWPIVLSWAGGRTPWPQKRTVTTFWLLSIWAPILFGRNQSPAHWRYFFQRQQNWQKWPNRTVPLGGAYLSFLRPVFQCSYHFHMLLKIRPLNSILFMITGYAVSCWTAEIPNDSTSFLFYSHHGAHPYSPLQWYRVANPRTNILSKIETFSSARPKLYSYIAQRG